MLPFAEQHLLGLAPDWWVAIGTLALAGATVWLGFVTKQLGQAAQRDSQAQLRPVLVPRERDGRPAVRFNQGEEGLEGTIAIINAGQGPALDVWVHLDTPATTVATAKWDAIPRDATHVFSLLAPDDLDHASIRVSYRSVSGEHYPSKFVLEPIPDSYEWKITNVLVHGREAFM